MSLCTMSGGAAAENLDCWNMKVGYKIIQTEYPWILRHANKTEQKYFVTLVNLVFRHEIDIFFLIK